MSDNCFKKNDLLVAGTRRTERLYKALDPAYIVPDERSIAGLMVFISNYAGLINYYALKGPGQKEYAVDGDWKSLIQSDEAFNYAGISVTPYSLPNITFYKYVNLYETGSTITKRNAAYRALWDVLFSVYSEINRFYSALPVYMTFRREVAAEIKNMLITDLGLTAGAYLNDSAALPTVNLQIITSSADDEYKFGFADSIIRSGFDKIWIDTDLTTLAEDWNDYLSLLPAGYADQFFNTADLPGERDRIDYSTLQLKQIFKRAFETYARIIIKANENLQSSLENNSSHFAHHGLMLAFLKLFGVLQTDINDFSRKHLEYYYSRVLKIDPAPPVPDAAHIVFEPAKNINSHLIRKDTTLNGGKDATGKLLTYSTDDEIVISQAKAEQLKTIYLKPGSAVNTVSRVFASPVANSADGTGAPFTGDDISWKGFGDEHSDPLTGNISNSAILGFFIASPVLHLTEGRRVIDFVFTTDSTGIFNIKKLTRQKLIKLLTLSFSGENQWEPLIITDDLTADHNCELNFIPPVSGSTFTIQLILPPLCKPVVGYDAAVCPGNLNTIFPVIKFELNQNSTEPNAYESFRNIVISRITLTTTVSEISNLSIQNELGTLDSTKPVQPFGPNPRKDSVLYIGHAELEHKNISSIVTSIEWLGLNPDLHGYYSYYSSAHKVDVNGTSTYPSICYITGLVNNGSFKLKNEFIRNKEWKSPLVSETSFFTNPVTMDFTTGDLKLPLLKPSKYSNDIISYSPVTQNGFIRFSLSAPNDAFGHTIWQVLFAKQTIALTDDPDPTHNTLPNPPYTPLLASIKLKYTASQDLFLDSTYKPEQGQFFHLLPFGIREKKGNVNLVPEFEIEKRLPNGTTEHKPFESSLQIGISNAAVNQNISLLLQMNEGTEDISVDPPAVIWNYLSGSGWKNLEKDLLSDTTQGLLRSGIVRFRVPADTDLSATELPPGFMWVSAAIEPDLSLPVVISSVGLPKVLAVYTNAVKATFKDKGNDPEHTGKPLPGNNILKLYESDAAVKKVNQPFATFGGKKKEEGIRFYTRVSERLRHKKRAVSIWDFERLVLNEFSEVYMVKCLNHTGYQKDCNNPDAKGIYRENLPGSVMLVPVPFINKTKTGNIYQPALSTAKLSEIKNFIHGFDNNDSCNKFPAALHCQLAKLLVENPKYETVKVTCGIRVKDCLDANFYRTQLGEDLNNFLSPWIKGDEGKINFGGQLHASQVVYFIEQLPYIDYLDKLTIEHRDGSTVLNGSEPALAVTTSSRSVLTSIGNDIDGKPQHLITIL